MNVFSTALESELLTKQLPGKCNLCTSVQFDFGDKKIPQVCVEKTVINLQT
jgi:hypothetical protein